MKRYTFPLLAVLCGVLGLGFVAGQAIAEPAPVATSIGGPYRPLYVAALVAAAPAVSDAPTSPLVELQALKTAYEKLKANQDPSLKPLLWAGLLAVGLKTLLSLANAIWKKPKKWLAWTALIAAVPIALLAHYAGGNGLLASIVVAGGGPGAILAHELLKLVSKSEATA